MAEWGHPAILDAEIFEGKIWENRDFWALAISIFIISEIFKVQWMSAKSYMKFQNLCFKFQNLCFYISGSGSLYLGTKFFVIMFHTLFLGYKIDVFRFWNLFFCQNTLQNLRFGYVKYCPYCCLILLSYSNHFFHVKKLWKMYFF